MESPTNPLLTVIDLKGVADVAHKKVQETPVIIASLMYLFQNCTVVVDNTFMSPYFQVDVIY